MWLKACPGKTDKCVKNTYYSIFSTFLFIVDCMEVSQQSCRETIFKGKSLINNNYHVLSIQLHYLKSFFDISCALGDASAVIILEMLNRSDRRLTWNVLKSIEIIEQISTHVDLKILKILYKLGCYFSFANSYCLFFLFQSGSYN